MSSRSSESLEILAANALRHIARNEQLKEKIEQNPVLFPLLLRAAKRYIGGSTRDQCLNTVQMLNGAGHAATVDYMGESTRDRDKARAETQEFLRLAADLRERNLHCSVSLDLSHIGLVASPALGLENARTLASATRDLGTEMIISMEASDRADSILAVYRELCSEFDHVGITLQARLHRTANDLKEMMQIGGKIRLVKGAYEEPVAVALEREDPALIPAYVLYAKMLLDSGQRCSIATHDPVIHDELRTHIERHNLRGSPFEFEVLVGLGNDQITALQQQGFNTRVYVVYGKEWFLYVCQRIAEQPSRLFQALADVIGTAPEHTDGVSVESRHSSLFPHR